MTELLCVCKIIHGITKNTQELWKIHASLPQASFKFKLSATVVYKHVYSRLILYDLRSNIFVVGSRVNQDT